MKTPRSLVWVHPLRPLSNKVLPTRALEQHFCGLLPQVLASGGAVCPEKAQQRGKAQIPEAWIPANLHSSPQDQGQGPAHTPRVCGGLGAGDSRAIYQKLIHLITLSPQFSYSMSVF